MSTNATRSADAAASAFDGGVASKTTPWLDGSRTSNSSGPGGAKATALIAGGLVPCEAAREAVPEAAREAVPEAAREAVPEAAREAVPEAAREGCRRRRGG